RFPVACLRRCSVRIFKVSPRDDRTSHHLKEVRRNGGYADSLRCTVQTRKGEAKRIDGGEILEIVFCAVAQVKIVRIREREFFNIPFLEITARPHQPLRILL